MLAIILNRYNGPLVLSEVPRPKPLAGQVLVRIAASGLNPLDTKIRSGGAAHAKHSVPLVLGIGLAGVVEEVGAGVTAFKVVDEVYGMTGGAGGVGHACAGATVFSGSRLLGCIYAVPAVDWKEPRTSWGDST